MHAPAELAGPHRHVNIPYLLKLLPRIPLERIPLTTRGFWSWAQAEPDRIAIIDPGVEMLSAGQILSLCNRVTNKLVASGLTPGDVVAIMFPSGPDLLVFTLATRQCGLYLLHLNPRSRTEELEYFLRDSAPKLLVLDPKCVTRDFASFLRARFHGAVEWLSQTPFLEDRLSSFIGEAADVEPAVRVAGDSLSYTSGTTGQPKAVLRKLRPISPDHALRPLLEWYQQVFRIDYSADGGFLSACPLYFSGPLSFAMYAIHSRRTLVIMPQWHSKLALSLIARHRVTETFLVPYQLRELTDAAKSKPVTEFSTLQAIVHGSAPCPPQLKTKAMEVFGDIIYECYGSTEVAGTVATPSDAKNYEGTVGRPVYPQEVRILNDLNEECGIGEHGRVFMKVLPGLEFVYRDDPESTAANQVDGFATVGDIGYLNATGHLFLKGRTSDVFNLRGEKFYPVDLENAAIDHPDVADAVAFVEISADGEDVMRLAVQLQNTSRAVEVLPEIYDVLGGCLKSAQLPTSIIVVSKILRGPVGKVARANLSTSIRRLSITELTRDACSEHMRKKNAREQAGETHAR